MASESESGEDTAPRDGDYAAHLALGAASRAKADAYLEKNARLIDLQIADMEREDQVRHWSLRVRHISDVLKLGFELAVAFIVVVVAIGLAATIWQAAHADGLVIESFNVPQPMAERGITGEVIGGKLLDKLTRMQNETQSLRAASTYANDWTNDIKVEIPDTGMSLGQVVRFLNGWLGHQMHLSGDLYETADSIAMTARIDDEPGQTFTGKPADLDAVVARAAEAVYARAQPYRYSVYLGGQMRFPESIDVLRRLVVTGPPMDRAWGFVGLSYLYTTRGEYERARAYNIQGRQIDPHLWNLSDTVIEQMQDHEERQLLETRREVALLDGGSASGSDAKTVRLYRQLDVGVEDQLVGDYQAALANDVFPPDTAPDAAETVAVGIAASMHDVSLARYHLRQADDMPLALIDSANRDCSAGQLFLDEQDWRAAIAQFEKAAASFTALDAQTQGWLAARPQITVNVAPFEAYAEAKLGDFAKADGVLAATPEDCDTCVLARGRIAALRKDWSGAARWFVLVSARSPDIPFADTDWGQMLMAKGDLDGAIAKFASANKKGPHFADPLEMWGEALIAKNRSDLALAKFAEANKYAPNWGRLHLKWGEALLWSGDKIGAQKQFAVARGLYLTPSETSELVKVSHG